MNLEELKTRNNKYLHSIGIETNPNLPVIEGLSEVNPRTAQEVAGRLCAIAYVIGIGFGADKNDLTDQLKEYDLWNHVSDYEKSLLESSNISEQDRINMEWLSESAQVLAWSIGLAELDNFKHCDDDIATKIPFEENPQSFIESASLQPIEAIQEQSDLLYRMHWYTKNHSTNKDDCLLSPGIVMERRKAIDWVYGVEQDWDEVPLDT